MDSAEGRGAAESELAFHCCSCGHRLQRHDMHTGRALAEAGGQQQDDGEAGEHGGQQANGTSSGGRGSDKWQSSAKVDAVMRLLRDLRAKAAAAGGCGCM